MIAFHPLPDAAWQGFTAEARKMLAFLAGRDTDVYRRYDHWWDKKLPKAEKQVLPGE